jgi:hypothetical protein
MSVFHLPAFSECTRDPLLLVSQNSHQLLRERKDRWSARPASITSDKFKPPSLAARGGLRAQRGITCALRGKKLITYATHPPRQHLHSEGLELKTKSVTSIRSAKIPQASRSFMMSLTFITNASHVTDLELLDRPRQGGSVIAGLENRPDDSLHILAQTEIQGRFAC